jgi:predicted TIM-barrel fold metal-dependent hydrolase
MRKEHIAHANWICGSDWPVVELDSGLVEWIGLSKDILSDLMPSDRTVIGI